MKYKVKYEVEGYDKEYETEAYETWELAESHRLDIKGYDGVKWAYLYSVEDDK
jgi:hypothetical protein